MNLFRKIKRISLVQVRILLAAGLMLILLATLLPRRLFNDPYSTVVTDRNGELLGARIADDGQWRFPPSDERSEKYEQCLRLFEDRWFYFHPGVNPVALVRATYQNLKARRVVSGGSTLSMQVVRLHRKNKPRTLSEKAVEIALSLSLELRYSKQSILSLYAAHAPFGGNVVGLSTAAWRYFGTTPDKLSWAEASMLAVLPNAPALIHPGRNRSTLLNKRNRLLNRLHEQGIIDSLTCELAKSEPLPERPVPMPQTAPHLVNHFFVTGNGHSWPTTLDAALQTRANEVLLRWNHVFAQNNIHNLAALIIDTPTGEVRAYCGNVNYETDRQHGNEVDVIRSPRSTGSILKPFLFCAMLQDGQLLPGSLVADVPLQIQGFRPQNFDMQYDGAVPARRALSRSLNIPAVFMLRQFSVSRFHHLLQKAGIGTLSYTPDHYGLSLILGGAEATLWDVAGIYASMGRVLLTWQNSLAYQPDDWHPARLQTSQYTNAAPTQTAPLFEAGAVWQTFEALLEVNRSEDIDWKNFTSTRKVAWKTGTSYGFRDGWAVGVTPSYTIAVWVGNAHGEGRPGLTGTGTAAPVLFDLFNLLPSSGWFQEPFQDLVPIEVCAKSGYRAGRNCPTRDTLLCCKAGLKVPACTFHQLVHVSADHRYRVFSHCAHERGLVSESWFVLPPRQEWYYKQKHADYRPLPLIAPECEGDDSAPVMDFIYPAEFTTLYIPRMLDGSKGKVIFELAHRDPNAKIFWHLDDTYVGETEHFHQLELAPSPGKHTLTVMDNQGRMLHKSFKVLDEE